MPDILVTGATGLIGARLVRALAGVGRVWALSRRRPDQAVPGVEWLVEDLTSAETALERLGRVDAVVHLAQSSRFRDFPDQALDVFDVNVRSTARLLDWGRRTGVKRFILASSGGIYGSGERGFTEDDPIGGDSPLGYYLASKHCAELLAESYAGQLTVTMLRFFFVYGPEQRRSMLVPRLVRSVADGQPITLQGPDGLRINPIHVDDAVGAIRRSLDLTEGHKINIGGPQVLTLRQIGDAIGRSLGIAPHYDVRMDAEPRHLVGDIAKMTRLLGAPSTRFDDGVAEVCAAIAGAGS